MRIASFTSALALLLASLLGDIASAQVQSMKLLTPDVGWATDPQRLFWTTNGGREWKDITPKKPIAEEQIASVFFLDASVGWVLLSRYAEPQPRFDLASTTDAGESWSISRLEIPGLKVDSAVLAGDGRIEFVDPLHGWMNLGIASGSNFHFGTLLVTANGGKSWNLAPGSPGEAGAIRFINLKDGWLAGGPGNEKLYVTHDGSNSWQEVSLKSPPVTYPATEPTYDLPVFRDSKHGFLPVTYSGPEGTGLALVLFVTNDGGATWNPDRVILRLPEIYSEMPVPSAVADSALMAATVSDHVLTFRTAASGIGMSAASLPAAKASKLPGISAIQGLSFTDGIRGWALTGDQLLSTSDGGANWNDVTPTPLRKAHPSVPAAFVKALWASATTSAKRLSSREGALLYPFPSPPDLSIHLGFDKCQASTASTMQTWWNYSPYFDTGIYIGGISRTCSQPNLTPSWVTQVESQGWGLMMLWPGPQAPCACKPGTGTYPNCTLFPHTFSFTPSVAHGQGATEADSAETAAKGLGLPGLIIYYDLENYSSSYCGTAAAAFVNGWVTELHKSVPDAGVYGSGANAGKDWPSVPDDVWIAKYDNRVTILGLAMSDSLWPDNQRNHQYRGAHNETYPAGSTPLSIDNDIEDAPIVAGLGDKIYGGFNFSDITYPGAAQTVPQGINNVNSSGTLISASGQTGHVVGAYYNSTGPVNAFLDNSGALSNVNDPLASSGTVAYDINDQAQIVGAYGSNTLHGFIKKGTATPVTIDYPGAIETSTIGINDDGQIVGWYLDSVGIHAFRYNQGSDKKFETFDGPGSTYTEAIGINGDGQIVGFYKDSSGNAHGFLWNSGSDGTDVLINYPGAPQTKLLFINNNGQITGQYVDSSSNSHSFLYNEADQSFLILPNDPNACSPGCSAMIGINDSAQMPGEYTTTSGGPIQGFLAVPK